MLKAVGVGCSVERLARFQCVASCDRQAMDDIKGSASHIRC